MTKVVLAQEARVTPIIFGAESVKAILEGRKTMTRRTRGLNEINREPDEWDFCDFNGYGNPVFTKDERRYTEIKNPFGMEGDGLWVRETWRSYDLDGTPEGAKQTLRYRADREEAMIDWRNPMYMPRWASRITLELTEVRVERLQEITEDNAVAEGMCEGEDCRWSHHAEGYREAWDSLNARRGFPWKINPYVWVLAFRLIPHIP